MFKNICIIGAGNIGSRHLQGLAKIKQALRINVIDPFDDSLSLAKKRFEEISNNSNNQIKYSPNLNSITNNIDIAIIATNSNIRSHVIKQLLAKSFVKYLILEKILFDKENQYKEMLKILSENKVKAWVNCSRRTMPFYRNLINEVKGQKIHYLVSGSQWGLASNSIHLIDHIALLTNCYDFEVDTKNLDPKISESKRKGFIELTGTLNVYFKDGSIGSFTCYKSGNAPQIMQIFSEKFRCLTLETEGKSYISKTSTNWRWSFIKTPMLYQSEMTNLIVTTLLEKGICNLIPLDLSTKLHLQLFKPLVKFVNENSKAQYNRYPFT